MTRSPASPNGSSIAHAQVGGPTKAELLAWVNNLLDLKLTKIEQLGSGAVFCQLLDAVVPDCVSIAKVNFHGKEEHEVLPNWKLYTAALSKAGFASRDWDVARLSRGSPAENLELLQWMYKQLAGQALLPGYQPAARRSLSIRKGTSDIPLPAACSTGVFNSYARTPTSPSTGKSPYQPSGFGKVNVTGVNSKFKAGLVQPSLLPGPRRYAAVPQIGGSWEPRPDELPDGDSADGTLQTRSSQQDAWTQSVAVGLQPEMLAQEVQTAAQWTHAGATANLVTAHVSGVSVGAQARVSEASAALTEDLHDATYSTPGLQSHRGTREFSNPYYGGRATGTSGGTWSREATQDTLQHYPDGPSDTHNVAQHQWPNTEGLLTEDDDAWAGVVAPKHPSAYDSAMAGIQQLSKQGSPSTELHAAGWNITVSNELVSDGPQGQMLSPESSTSTSHVPASSGSSYAEPACSSSMTLHTLGHASWSTAALTAVAVQQEVFGSPSTVPPEHIWEPGSCGGSSYASLVASQQHSQQLQLTAELHAADATPDLMQSYCNDDRQACSPYVQPALPQQLQPISDPNTDSAACMPAGLQAHFAPLPSGPDTSSAYVLGHKVFASDGGGFFAPSAAAEVAGPDACTQPDHNAHDRRRTTSAYPATESMRDMEQVESGQAITIHHSSIDDGTGTDATAWQADNSTLPADNSSQVTAPAASLGLPDESIQQPADRDASECGSLRDNDTAGHAEEDTDSDAPTDPDSGGYQFYGEQRGRQGSQAGPSTGQSSEAHWRVVSVNHDEESPDGHAPLTVSTAIQLHAVPGAAAAAAAAAEVQHTSRADTAVQPDVVYAAQLSDSGASGSGSSTASATSHSGDELASQAADHDRAFNEYESSIQRQDCDSSCLSSRESVGNHAQYGGEAEQVLDDHHAVRQSPCASIEAHVQAQNGAADTQQQLLVAADAAEQLLRALAGPAGHTPTNSAAIQQQQLTGVQLTAGADTVGQQLLGRGGPADTEKKLSVAIQAADQLLQAVAGANAADQGTAAATAHEQLPVPSNPATGSWEQPSDASHAEDQQQLHAHTDVTTAEATAGHAEHGMSTDSPAMAIDALVVAASSEGAAAAAATPAVLASSNLSGADNGTPAAAATCDDPRQGRAGYAEDTASHGLQHSRSVADEQPVTAVAQADAMQMQCKHATTRCSAEPGAPANACTATKLYSLDSDVRSESEQTCEDRELPAGPCSQFKRSQDAMQHTDVATATTIFTIQEQHTAVHTHSVVHVHEEYVHVQHTTCLVDKQLAQHKAPQQQACQATEQHAQASITGQLQPVDLQLLSSVPAQAEPGPVQLAHDTDSYAYGCQTQQSSLSRMPQQSEVMDCGPDQRMPSAAVDPQSDGLDAQALSMEQQQSAGMGAAKSMAAMSAEVAEPTEQCAEHHVEGQQQGHDVDPDQHAQESDSTTDEGAQVSIGASDAKVQASISVAGTEMQRPAAVDADMQLPARHPDLQLQLQVPGLPEEVAEMPTANTGSQLQQLATASSTAEEVQEAGADSDVHQQLQHGAVAADMLLCADTGDCASSNTEGELVRPTTGPQLVQLQIPADDCQLQGLMDTQGQPQEHDSDRLCGRTANEDTELDNRAIAEQDQVRAGASALSSTSEDIEQHASADSTAEKHARSTGAPEQHTSMTSASEQHISSTEAPEHHASSTSTPEQHTSSTSPPEEHTSSTSTPRQHASSTIIAEQLQDSVLSDEGTSCLPQSSEGMQTRQEMLSCSGAQEQPLGGTADPQDACSLGDQPASDAQQAAAAAADRPASEAQQEGVLHTTVPCMQTVHQVQVQVEVTSASEEQVAAINNESAVLAAYSVEELEQTQQQREQVLPEPATGDSEQQVLAAETEQRLSGTAATDSEQQLACTAAEPGELPADRDAAGALAADALAADAPADDKPAEPPCDADSGMAGSAAAHCTVEDSTGQPHREQHVVSDVTDEHLSKASMEPLTTAADAASDAELLNSQQPVGIQHADPQPQLLSTTAQQLCGAEPLAVDNGVAQVASSGAGAHLQLQASSDSLQHQSSIGTSEQSDAGTHNLTTQQDDASAAVQEQAYDPTPSAVKLLAIRSALNSSVKLTEGDDGNATCITASTANADTAMTSESTLQQEQPQDCQQQELQGLPTGNLPAAEQQAEQGTGLCAHATKDVPATAVPELLPEPTPVATQATGSPTAGGAHEIQPGDLTSQGSLHSPMAMAPAFEGMLGICQGGSDVNADCSGAESGCETGGEVCSETGGGAGEVAGGEAHSETGGEAATGTGVLTAPADADTRLEGEAETVLDVSHHAACADMLNAAEEGAAGTQSTEHQDDSALLHGASEQQQADMGPAHGQQTHHADTVNQSDSDSAQDSTSPSEESPDVQGQLADNPAEHTIRHSPCQVQHAEQHLMTVATAVESSMLQQHQLQLLSAEHQQAQHSTELQQGESVERSQALQQSKSTEQLDMVVTEDKPPASQRVQPHAAVEQPAQADGKTAAQVIECNSSLQGIQAATGGVDASVEWACSQGMEQADSNADAPEEHVLLQQADSVPQQQSEDVTTGDDQSLSQDQPCVTGAAGSTCMHSKECDAADDTTAGMHVTELQAAAAADMLEAEQDVEACAAGDSEMPHEEQVQQVADHRQDGCSAPPTAQHGHGLQFAEQAGVDSSRLHHSEKEGHVLADTADRQHMQAHSSLAIQQQQPALSGEEDVMAQSVCEVQLARNLQQDSDVSTAAHSTEPQGQQLIVGKRANVQEQQLQSEASGSCGISSEQGQHDIVTSESAVQQECAADEADHGTCRDVTEVQRMSQAQHDSMLIQAKPGCQGLGYIGEQVIVAIAALQQAAAADKPALEALQQAAVADMPAPEALQQAAVADMPAPEALQQAAAADPPAPEALQQAAVADMPAPEALQQAAVADMPAPEALQQAAAADMPVPEALQQAAVADEPASEAQQRVAAAADNPAAELPREATAAAAADKLAGGTQQHESAAADKPAPEAQPEASAADQPAGEAQQEASVADKPIPATQVPCDNDEANHSEVANSKECQLLQPPVFGQHAAELAKDLASAATTPTDPLAASATPITAPAVNCSGSAATSGSATRPSTLTESGSLLFSLEAAVRGTADAAAGTSAGGWQNVQHTADSVPGDPHAVDLTQDIQLGAQAVLGGVDILDAPQSEGARSLGSSTSASSSAATRPSSSLPPDAVILLAMPNTSSTGQYTGTSLEAMAAALDTATHSLSVVARTAASLNTALSVANAADPSMQDPSPSTGAVGVSAHELASLKGSTTACTSNAGSINSSTAGYSDCGTEQQVDSRGAQTPHALDSPQGVHLGAAVANEGLRPGHSHDTQLAAPQSVVMGQTAGQMPAEAAAPSLLVSQQQVVTAAVEDSSRQESGESQGGVVEVGRAQGDLLEFAGQGQLRSIQDGMQTLLRHTADLLADVQMQSQSLEAARTPHAGIAPTTQPVTQENLQLTTEQVNVQVYAQRAAELQVLLQSQTQQMQQLSTQLAGLTPAASASAASQLLEDSMSVTPQPTGHSAGQVSESGNVDTAASHAQQGTGAAAVVGTSSENQSRDLAIGRAGSPDLHLQQEATPAGDELQRVLRRGPSLARQVHSTAVQEAASVDAALKAVGAAQFNLTQGIHRDAGSRRASGAGSNALDTSTILSRKSSRNSSQTDEDPQRSSQQSNSHKRDSNESKGVAAESSLADGGSTSCIGSGHGTQANKTSSEDKTCVTAQRAVSGTLLGPGRAFKLGEYQIKQLRNGDVYKGRRVGRCKDGHGIYVFANGDVYEGQFKSDRMDGHGVYTFSHEGRYTGSWSMAVYHGAGCETFARGSMYTGEYASGLRSGWGVCRFFNGDYYEGQWVAGLRHGQGMQQCTDGSNYVGEYQRGKRNGQGVYTFPNGDKYAGEYMDDLPHGHGVYTFATGQKYEGQWQAGRKHGWSTYNVEDGSRWAAHWQEGKALWVESLGALTDRASHGQQLQKQGSRKLRERAGDGGQELQQQHSGGFEEEECEEGLPGYDATQLLQLSRDARSAAVQAATQAERKAMGHWAVQGGTQTQLKAALAAAETAATAAREARRCALELSQKLDVAVSLARNAQQQQQQAGDMKLWIPPSATYQ